jgi:hypothetical protein
MTGDAPRSTCETPFTSTRAPALPRGRRTSPGLAATDWTWSVRLEDLDNDGRLDLFVTNGMHREVTTTPT